MEDYKSMKFISISKAKNNQEETIEKFKEELNVFKLKYRKDYDFDIYFPDEYHLMVQIETSNDFSEEVHDDLCETFDVNLHYVSHYQQQNPNTIIKYIELIYTPKHHYTNNLNWEDVVLEKEIKFY